MNPFDRHNYYPNNLPMDRLEILDNETFLNLSNPPMKIRHRKKVESTHSSRFDKSSLHSRVQTTQVNQLDLGIFLPTHPLPYRSEMNSLQEPSSTCSWE